MRVVIDAASSARRFASDKAFGRSVFRGRGDRRTVALTFDDGPTPDSIHVARYLERSGIRATFFQCGLNALRHPEITRELAAAGHEIGNHTFSHRRLSPRVGWQMNFLSTETIYREFAQTQQIISELTGADPVLMRPPYGLRWIGLKEVQRRLGLTAVLWTVIAHDWEWDASAATEHVVGGASPGGIICLHDGRDTRPNPDVSVTLNALKRIVPRLQELGYGFETVSQIIMPRTEPVWMDPTGDCTVDLVAR
jgi:peptidoglycan/xylan/chitin deacetylase (PgdA/CDA1 family)